MKTTPIAGLLTAALLSGCISTRNDGLALGGDVQLEGFSPPAPVAQEINDGPSITGMDRSHWHETPLVVPVNGLAHKPTYIRVRTAANATRRQRGEYPTLDSSLELAPDTLGIARREAFFAPLRAAWDLVMIVPRAAVTRPWKTRWSPVTPSQRYLPPVEPATETRE